MSGHTAYLWSCVSVWVVTIAWNVIPPYWAWKKKTRKRNAS